MADELPEPFTPADCDLRGMEWMPLYGARLFASETWILASPEGRCAALALWWASWQQSPCASLADDDRSLAHLAGYGSALSSWRKIKPEALRGWVRCSDGRLYHSVVAELAVDAWQHRARAKTRRDADRKRLEKWREKRASEQDGNALRNGGGNAFPNGFQGRFETAKDRTGQDSTPQAPHPETRFSRDPRFAKVAEAVWRERSEAPGYGPEVNGLYLDVAWEMLAEAGGFNAEKPPPLGPLVAWLQADIYPDAIAAAVSRISGREGYRPPRSLAYFDSAVRGQR